jgi:hypothetical protein
MLEVDCQQLAMARPGGRTGLLHHMHCPCMLVSPLSALCTVTSTAAAALDCLFHIMHRLLLLLCC